jgi:hypothetical protein
LTAPTGLGLPTTQGPRGGIFPVEQRVAQMTRTELIIQLLKVAIGLAFGAYFVWWSLQVLDRLTPEYDAAAAVVDRADFAPSRAGRDRCMYKERRGVSLGLDCTQKPC